MMQLLPSDILAKLERNTKNDSLLKSRSANTSPYQKPLLQNLQLLPHLSPTIVPATPGHKLLLGQEIAALLMAKWKLMIDILLDLEQRMRIDLRIYRLHREANMEDLAANQSREKIIMRNYLALKIYKEIPWRHLRRALDGSQLLWERRQRLLMKAIYNLLLRR